MLSTQQTHELESLTTRIHAQILHDYGSSADAPTELAHRALHNLLAGMFDRENPARQARVSFAAPTGFGKSTACAALILAAYQLQHPDGRRFLGNGVSVTYAAARVGQNFIFEQMLQDEGFPTDDLRTYVSVLHGSKVDGKEVLRPSDTNLDVPVLLITHERVRKVYRRAEGWTEKDLCFFLKYRDDERLLLWDERCLCAGSQRIYDFLTIIG